MSNEREKTGSAAVRAPLGPFDSRWIASVLPHRYPILLVDRVLELVPGERVVAIKNVTRNEPFFDGHFPGNPIMPGVLVIEAMAQTAGLLLLHEIEDRDRRVLFFSGIERGPLSPSRRSRRPTANGGGVAAPAYRPLPLPGPGHGRRGARGGGCLHVHDGGALKDRGPRRGP